MKKILGEFLRDDPRVKEPPTDQRKVYQDREGNELWVKLYRQQDGYCLVTVMTKFPKQGIEVETKYDTGYPPKGEDPLDICTYHIINDWGVEHFITFHEVFYLRRSSNV